MKDSLATLGALVLMVSLAPAPVRAAETAMTLVVPDSGLVLDGGDFEGPTTPAVAPVDETGVTAVPAVAPLAASLAALDAQSVPAPAPRPIAFEYSDGYYTRLKIHKWASFATLPLFVTQTVLGQKLYNGTGSDSTRSAHNAVAVGTGVLFGVNTVTGVWNLVEGRKDPNRKTTVKVHSILMLVADAGFAVSGFMAPHTEHGDFNEFESSSGVSQSTHRTVALSSMGIATISYLVMLFGH